MARSEKASRRALRCFSRKAWFFAPVDEPRTLPRARLLAIAALALLAVLTHRLPALGAATGAALVLVVIAAVETHLAPMPRSPRDQAATSGAGR